MGSADRGLFCGMPCQVTCPTSSELAVGVSVGVGVGGHACGLKISCSPLLRLAVLHEYSVSLIPVARCTPTVAPLPLWSIGPYMTSNLSSPSYRRSSKFV